MTAILTKRILGLAMLTLLTSLASLAGSGTPKSVAQQPGQIKKTPTPTNSIPQQNQNSATPSWRELEPPNPIQGQSDPFLETITGSRRITIAGLVKKIDYGKKEILVRLSATQFTKGAEALVRFTSSTVIKMGTQKGQRVPLSYIKDEEDSHGSAITVSGTFIRRRSEKYLKANQIILLTACDCTVCAYCPRENCNRKCGAEACTCPAK
jgi:hypothetical protein